MIKFNLYCDGQIIRSLEDLRGNFNIDDVYDSYINGKLVEWLQSRNYEREYVQIERIKDTDKKMVCDKLCTIFSVDNNSSTNVTRGITGPKALTKKVNEKNSVKTTIEDRVFILEEKISRLETVIEKLCNQTGSEDVTNQIGSQIKNVEAGTRKYYSKFKNVCMGDTVKFGHYCQEKVNSITDIEWQVLDVEDEKVLLVSKLGLDGVSFDSSSNKWETSYIRRWLRSSFLKKAFNDDEAKLILDTNTEDNCKDKVFLLSVAEAKKYFSNKGQRLCYSTAYAMLQGVKNNSVGICNWWLRTAALGSDSVARVSNNGDIVTDYYGTCNFSSYCVRPAIWIKIL